jgi:hypothetical protein
LPLTGAFLTPPTFRAGADFTPLLSAASLHALCMCAHLSHGAPRYPVQDTVAAAHRQHAGTL